MTGGPDNATLKGTLQRLKLTLNRHQLRKAAPRDALPRIPLRLGILQRILKIRPTPHRTDILRVALRNKLRKAHMLGHLP